MATNPRLLVLGDISLDWHIIKSPINDPAGVSWNADPGEVTARPGGARLLSHLATQCLGCEIVPAESPAGTDGLANALITPPPARTMAICALFAQDPQSKNRVLRIESLSGFQAPAPKPPLLLPTIEGHPDLIVIDDAGITIRQQADQVISFIEPFTSSGKGELPWVILKVAWPVLENPLLEKLASMWGDKLIVVAPIDDLRRDNIQVSKGLSWESTAQDLLWERTYNPRMKLFASVHALVVPLGLSGIWLSCSQPPNATRAPESAASAHLVFDPSSIEGGWEKDRPGLLLGYTSCLTLALINALLQRRPPDLSIAAHCGLSAMRALHTNGYTAKPGATSVELPLANVREAINKPTQFSQATVPLGYRHYSAPAACPAVLKRKAQWSILKQNFNSSRRLSDLAG
jgi:hypothetical protein